MKLNKIGLFLTALIFVGGGYCFSQTSQVKIIVYDLFGKEIKVLVNEEKAPGHHEIVFDREDFVSGIYFYTLKTAGIIQSKKMILMK